MSGDVGAEVAAVLAFRRCSDVHADRHDMGGPGVCRACQSWGRLVADTLAPLVVSGTVEDGAQ